MEKYLMHVISGTHWDREWRHTAEQSKLRLMELMDSVITILETREDYRCFCVDGGAIVLEDYLTVRPENRERIKKLVKAKRMHVVNWYTLPEMFTVAPESLIRNLLAGKRMANEFGGGIASGYTATSYGQLSQLPQIYRGFDIQTAIFYRGTNTHVLPPLFSWEGPDGSRLHALRTFDDTTRTNWFFYVHQPLVLDKPPRDVFYYYNREDVPVHPCDEGSYERPFLLLREKVTFNRDEARLKKALQIIESHTMPHAIGRHLLALNMEDNARPFPLLPEMIAALNAVSPDVEIIQDSLDDYMEAVIAEVEGQSLVVHRGELRYPVVEAGWNGLNGATHSSRIRLKLLNEIAETSLIFVAEPLASIASVYGSEYPRTNLRRAWETLLKNHAHDSICGAAVDQAHEDMVYRFSLATAVAQEVAARSVMALSGKINSAENFRPTDHTITLFNTLNFSRREVIPVVVDLPRESGIAFFDIVDERGNEIEHVELSSEETVMSVERELDTWTTFQAIRKRLLLYAGAPEMGYATYALRPRGPNYVTHPEIGPDRPLIARENGVLENEHLRVEINPNGTFSLLHKETGKKLENLHYFTDAGEIGSAHKSMQPQRNPVYTSLGNATQITLVETNPLRGVYRVDLSLIVPTATLGRRDRSREMIEVPISCWLTLEKGGTYLKIKTRLHNEARDHKLRVHFPTGIRADWAAAESAFAVEKRSIRWTETGDNDETFFPFQPMQNFVDVSDGQIGLAVLTRGLREYEVSDDPDRTIAITLIRTHRAYMTASVPTTPEELDKYTGLQNFDDFEYRYALYPHTGDWDAGGVLRAAYQHKVDVKAIQGVPIAGGLPGSGSFFVMRPTGAVMLSALKQSEDGSGIILRVWNPGSQKQDVTITTTLPVETAKIVRLDETPVADAGVNDGKISLAIDLHKIETLLLDIWNT